MSVRRSQHPAAVGDSGAGGYSDIAAGTTVTVYDATGTIVGTTGLGQGTGERMWGDDTDHNPSLRTCRRIWCQQVLGPGVIQGTDMHHDVLLDVMRGAGLVDLVDEPVVRRDLAA